MAGVTMDVTIIAGCYKSLLDVVGHQAQYSRVFCGFFRLYWTLLEECLVPRAGVEPATCPLGGGCSIHLNYRSMLGAARDYSVLIRVCRIYANSGH